MRGRRTTLLLLPFVAAVGWQAATQVPSSRVLVLEDFETPEAAARWEGPLEIAADHASHGRQAARLRLDREHPQVSSARLAADWRGYDRLLFDLYTESDVVSTATVRIYDQPGGDLGQAARDDYFDGRNKIFVQKGWIHVEVKLTPLKAGTFLRDLSLDRIRRLVLSFDAMPLPATFYVDNIRLVAGEEAAATISRMEPQDTVSSVDNRWVSVRQVARPEDVPEAADVAALRKRAEQESELLTKTIHAAQTQGIDTSYAERHLVTSDLGLRVRPLLAWYNNDTRKRQMFTFVADSCRQARYGLEDKLRGLGVREEVDDTQAGQSSIRPLPRLKGRSARGWFFRDEQDEPMMVLSVHSPSRALQRFFATPLQHIESYSVGGGSRWTIDQSPVYDAFKADPDTHRVGWDGWCGHLVRDLSSMGGTKKENVVICLESPRIRQAVSEYIRANTPKFHANPELLYDIMAYELMYICYCDRSRRGFHEWLETKHGSIARANELWQTTYTNFKDVIPPPVRNSRPLDGTNRALWYDWARYNQERFTDYLLWVRSEIRKTDTTVPLAAGGSSSMLAGRTGTTGIDEERIVNEVDDVIIHEGGGTTLGVDLQLALSDKSKPLADPEMSLGAVENLLPHFLHGKSVAQIYHWPTQPANEFYSNNRSSLAHSWAYSLADVDEVLRVALDVRRLNREIAAFVEAPAEVAILYSQTATLQLPPEMLTWQTTPYVAELHNTYEAAQYLDAKITFVTERQALNGKLDRYKLLLVPAVRNLPRSVVQAIWEYAARGGHVFIVPESLRGDEYNRPQDYVAHLGITVRATQFPKRSAAGRMVQGYDQSFSREVSFVDDTPLKLAGPLNLQTRGVKQNLEVGAGVDILYRYPDGSPAIVRTPLGKGTIEYSACSLEPRGYARLLDQLLSRSAVTRPVQVRGAGNDHWRVEARFARSGSRRLLYVVNFNPAPVQLTIESAAGSFHSIRELRDNAVVTGSQITVPARQTAIYELF
jgi:hypothetical protein